MRNCVRVTVTALGVCLAVNSLNLVTRIRVPEASALSVYAVRQANCFLAQWDVVGRTLNVEPRLCRVYLSDTLKHSACAATTAVRQYRHGTK